MGDKDHNNDVYGFDAEVDHMNFLGYKFGGSNPIGADSGDSDGYESDLSSGKNLSSGDFYVRLVNGNVQMALSEK